MFDTRRQIHGIANEGKLNFIFRADIPGNELPRVEPNPHMHWLLPFSTQLQVKRPELLLHTYSREHRVALIMGAEVCVEDL